MFDEKDFLALSGVQHFSFCKRQWSLIHVDREWRDNLLTVQGDLIHSRAHDEEQRERRGDLLVVRGLKVRSFVLGLYGVCDVVEFRRNPKGVILFGEDGLWVPHPVEYKRGKSKSIDADRLQLCAQAMCLEEMLCSKIDCGDLYYGQTHSREHVIFDAELRRALVSLSNEMHDAFDRGYVYGSTEKPQCRSCSLLDVCVASRVKKRSVANYVQKAIGSM